MPQTTVPTTLVVGSDGQLADLWTEENGVVDSVTSEETTAEIAFGKAVKKGTADWSALNLTAITEAVRGFAVWSQRYAKPDELGDTGLKPKVTFGILRMGRMIVKPEDGVDPTKSVFIRAVATGSEIPGSFRGTADGTDTIDISAVATWMSTASAGEPAVVEINLLGA